MKRITHRQKESTSHPQIVRSAAADDDEIGRFIAGPYADHAHYPEWAVNINFILEIWGISKENPEPRHTFDEMIERGREFALHRDLQDTIILVERFETFGRPIQMTEVGTSAGPTPASIIYGSLDFREEPYVWHRHWDEELQADWMEGLYTLGFAQSADRGGQLVRLPRWTGVDKERRHAVARREAETRVLPLEEARGEWGL